MVNLQAKRYPKWTQTRVVIRSGLGKAEGGEKGGLVEVTHGISKKYPGKKRCLKTGAQGEVTLKACRKTIALSIGSKRKKGGSEGGYVLAL